VPRIILLCTIVTAGMFLPGASPAQVDPLWNTIIGSAFTEPRALEILRRLTDEAGGRLVGSPSNERALTILAGELRALGIDVRREPFEIAGWVRGEDEVVVTSPLPRRLRAVALGYTDALPAFEDTAVYAGSGTAEEYAGIRAAGKIAVVSSATPAGKEPLLRLEAIGIAADHGARAVCFINDREGGLVLCGVADFEGKPSRIPAFSLTLEEGTWIERLSRNASAPRRPTSWRHSPEVRRQRSLSGLTWTAGMSARRRWTTGSEARSCLTSPAF
jgi:hypothetical protein